MLSKEMNNALNEQIKWELYSGYMYLAMSAWFSENGLPGFAHWMRLQAQEELSHAMKFYDFILNRGGSAKLEAIDAPPATWKNSLVIIEETLKHEQSVTDRINKLVHQARKENDYATEIFLQWFVTEQVEEEESVTDVLNKLKLIKGDGQGMLLIDKDLSARVISAPAE